MVTYSMFASGALGLKIVQSVLQATNPPAFIATDKKSVAIVEFASHHNIPVFAGNPRTERFIEFSRQYSYDFLVSTNYLFLLPAEVISQPRLMAVNFHGSLLPKYRGRTPLVWTIINGETEAGLTAHQIDNGCDTGDIIAQRKITIDSRDTISSLLDRVSEFYPLFVVDVLEMLQKGDYNLTRQDNSKATHFGKRVPEDGLLQWHWQKQRIFNWVRALADPYPGAFSYLNGKKVIIDWIELDEHGYDYLDPNGLILKGGNEPVVKTPNGAVRIVKYRYDGVFNQGEVFTNN